MNTQAILVLTHKPIPHIFEYATQYPNVNFYIHVDKKVAISNIKIKDMKNIFFLNDIDRIDIKWAGFSMIQATLNLIYYALDKDAKNEYFHLISADDVILNLGSHVPDDKIFMECYCSQKHRYRMRFNTLHADTIYQRNFIGKVLTQLYKKVDLLLPTKKKYYFGSQWFSISRNYLEILINSISAKDISFFEKKLCPDEHFFQYLVAKNNLLSQLSSEGNKRYIVFDSAYQHGSSPIWLNPKQLQEAFGSGYWFARKVQPEVISEFKTFFD